MSGFMHSSPGLSTSQAEQLFEIERHLHNWERWWAAAATPSGETHVADRITDNDTAFQVDAGNDDWGSWLQVLGSADTPTDLTFTPVDFDVHFIQFVAVERFNATHFLQLAFGDSGAAALAAGTYTERVVTPQSANGRAAPFEIIDRRRDVGTKGWLRIKIPGQNTGTADFFLGIHYYEAQ